MKDEYWKGQAVEVRLRHGTKENWIRARVDSPTRRGANVTNNTDGRQHHVFFNDMRPFPANNGRPVSRQIGTPVLDPSWAERNQGIVVKEKQPIEQIADISVPVKMPAALLALVPAETKTASTQKRRATLPSKKSQNYHNITPFASMLRAERLRRAKTQDEMAEFMGWTEGNKISRLELARLWPDDDVLLSVHEKLGIGLDQLFALRDGPLPNTTDSGPSYEAVKAADKIASIQPARSELEQLAARLVELRARADVLTAELAPIGTEIESIKNKMKELL